MNKERIRHLANHIELHPDKYNQNAWTPSNGACKGACCIAGTAVLIWGTPEQRANLVNYEVTGDQTSRWADEILGLNESGKDYGLYAASCDWPDAYVETDGCDEEGAWLVTPQMAARRLRNIADAGEEE